jgi:hypothetical protein
LTEQRQKPNLFFFHALSVVTGWKTEQAKTR